jgi:branched-subunit amino acid ABC-type transport system permease component
LPFLVIGVTTGSLYGLAAVGLVLTYRTSGVFNFAHGAVAAAGAYVFYSFYRSWGWPWPVAMGASVLLFGVVGGFILERLTRLLVGARTASVVVATVGLLLFVQGVITRSYGSALRTLPHFLPTSTAFTLQSVQVSWDQVISCVVGVVAFLALFLFLRSSRLGLSMRAVVVNPDLLGLAGTDPVRARVASWMIGSSVAALTGILIAPTLGLDVFLLSALVVQAFGAVAIGRFSSLPLTYLGGLAIGVLAALAAKQFATDPTLNGLPAVVPFLVLVAVMLITPARKLPIGVGRLSGKASRPSAVPRNVQWGAAGVGVLVLLLVPNLVHSRLPVYTTGLVFALLFLSLSLLTGTSGQISLAHAAFAGVGAATFGHFSVGVGMPWPVALLATGIVTGLVGGVLALPAMRLSGLYLALATYGFGLFMELVLFQSSWLFGKQQSGVSGRRPELGSLLNPRNDRDYYYVVLGVVLASAFLLVLLRGSRLGRYLRAMADSGTALRTMGLSVNVSRVLVFAISAFFAGVAGALYLGQIGQLNSVSFNSTYSLLYLAIFVVASILPGFLTPAFLAAGLLVIVPSYLTSVTTEAQSIVFGGTALLAAVLLDGQIDWRGLRTRAGMRIDRALAASSNRPTHSPVAERMRRSPLRAAGE